MKKSLLPLVLLLGLASVHAQPDKKPAKQPTTTPTSQPDMNKLLEEAMKAEGMSKEEQEEMKRLMKDVMPALVEQNSKTADYPEFSNNKQLVPRRDPGKIAMASKKALTIAEVQGYANGLYNKMMTRANAAEMAIVKKVVAQTPNAADISNAAVLAMLQGHPEAALALSIKAAASDPANLNYQNNMAAMLTSYGYPEQAMPILRKLKNDEPGNSTVLNNLGHAWMELGLPDSATPYIQAAIRSNPQHAEAKQAGGLIDELKGALVKAGDAYVEAMENAANPFTDQMLKNVNKGNYKLDFEKLKKMIAIYEYFPKNYLPDVPLLMGGVNNYANNEAEQAGYAKMLEDFKEQADKMIENLQGDLNNEIKKGEEEFINSMRDANLRGVSYMSKPATIVMKALLVCNQQWHQKVQKESLDLFKKISGWRTEMEKVTHQRWTKDECHIPDDARNKFMEKVNPLVREFWLAKAEELRQQLNAIATWNWYVTGNVKNVVMIQDVQLTALLVQMYESAIKTQEVLNGSCDSQTKRDPNMVYAPAIPAFTCPAVISIPTGRDWQQLKAAIKNMDDNGYGIKSDLRPTPNVSVSFGVGNMISEPGHAAFIKTAHGSVTPGNINNNDDDDDELVPIGKVHAPQNPANHTAEEDDLLVPLQQNLLNQKRQRSRLAKNVIDKMMQSDCIGVVKDIPDPKIKMLNELAKDVIERMRKKIEANKAMEDRKIKRMQELAEDVIDKSAKKIMEEAIKFHQDMKAGKMEFEDYMRSMDEVVKGLEGLGRLPTVDKIYEAFKVIDKMKNSAALIKHGPQVLNDIQQNGIQPTISSGLQAPGTFTPNKTLFQ